jgi:hypothetical protein
MYFSMAYFASFQVPNHRKTFAFPPIFAAMLGNKYGQLSDAPTFRKRLGAANLADKFKATVS